MDADLTRWGPHFVTGLLGPLLADPQVHLVKGFYERVRTEDDGSTSTEGGRVTELVARPLLSLWWPELAGVVQPLAGEWAARREPDGVAEHPGRLRRRAVHPAGHRARHGLDALAQVDLGSRAHRHQADHDLALMAAELLVVAEARRDRPAPPPARPRCASSSGRTARSGRASAPIPTRERPPLVTVAAATAACPAPAGDLSMPNASAAQRPLRLGAQTFPPDQRLVMAIVNRTPDSFYDRGATWDEAAAPWTGCTQVVAEGADILDIGGVAAAPGAPVDVAEEIRRDGAVRGRGPRRLPGPGDQRGHLAARGRRGRPARPARTCSTTPGAARTRQLRRGGRRVRRRPGLRARRRRRRRGPGRSGWPTTT